ncbi:MAG: hypothetical protein HOI53_06460, partial [Francisellaceae bacterium]|nr:hypothetical protein [Francisellaceae bacterium]
GKIHNLELEPFSIDETEAFLWCQWHLSGTKTQMPITGDLLVKLQQVSSGIVGNIIEVSQKIIDGKELPSVKPKISKRRYQIVLGAIVLGLGYLSISWILDKSKYNHTQTTVNIPTSIDEVKLEQPKSISDSIKLSAKAAKIEQKSPKANISESTLNSGSTIEIKSPENITKPKSVPQVTNNDDVQTSQSIAQLVKERIADDKTKNQDDIQALMDTPKIATQHEDKMPIDENLIKPPSHIVNVKNLNPQPLVRKIESNLKPKTLKVSNLEPNRSLNEAGKTTTTQKKSSSLYSVNENKLLAMSSVKFGWQLVASSQEEKIKDFIHHNNLKDTYYYTSTLNGKPWFVLIYGQFVSKNDANKAMKRLPKAIADMNPWLRDYESIHSSIIKSKRK